MDLIVSGVATSPSGGRRRKKNEKDAIGHVFGWEKTKDLPSCIL